MFGEKVLPVPMRLEVRQVEEMSLSEAGSTTDTMRERRCGFVVAGRRETVVADPKGRADSLKLNR